MLVCSANNAYACADTTIKLTLEKTIPGNYGGFYTDAVSNIYLINQNNEVKKLDAAYDSVAAFSDIRQYGDIYLLDVSNPLKEVVYYKDFGTILVLDRFLNPRNTINLRKSGLLQVTAVATSYDNNYWVFDELDNKIKKIDDYGNILLESADFRVLFAEGFTPLNIIDNDGLLYLYNEKQGWFFFDYYGAFKQKVELTGWKDVQVENKNLIGHDVNYLYISYPAALSMQRVKANINLATAIKIQKRGNKFFVLTNEGLSIYSL